MSINSRDKGARGERAFRDYLISKGYEARRGQQFSGSQDSPDVIHNIPDTHFEVKCVESLNIRKALAQAHRDAPNKRFRIVAHKTNRGDWLVTMLADEYITLIKSGLI